MLRMHGSVWAGILVACLSASATSCRQASRKTDLSLREWNDLIEKNLPRGSTRAAVEEFLDERQIPHSYIATSHFPDETNSIVAFIKIHEDGNLVKKSGIQLKFKFDADLRLISFESKEIFTGP